MATFAQWNEYLRREQLLRHGMLVPDGPVPAGLSERERERGLTSSGLAGTSGLTRTPTLPYLRSLLVNDITNNGII